MWNTLIESINALTGLYIMGLLACCCIATDNVTCSAVLHENPLYVIVCIFSFVSDGYSLFYRLTIFRYWCCSGSNVYSQHGVKELQY
jgi:hypothetical protein